MAFFSAKNGEDLTSSSKVINLNVWPHLIWPTLYMCIKVVCIVKGSELHLLLVVDLVLIDDQTQSPGKISL